jgi:hypothetical protein
VSCSRHIVQQLVYSGSYFVNEVCYSYVLLRSGNNVETPSRELTQSSWQVTWRTNLYSYTFVLSCTHFCPVL